MKLFHTTYKSMRCMSLLLTAVLTIGVPAQSALAAPGPGSETVGQSTVWEAAVQEATVQTEAKQPEIAAQSAVLYDATRGQFLFEKNADTQYYPASITKLMTALLVAEHCGLEGTVTFSETAVSKLESGAVTLKIQAGEKVSVKDCMYGLMLKSANEIANGLAEHVSGSIEAFADQMNQKAKSLGCTNTNFENPNGLNNPEHVTTARDMALIAAEAYKNDIVRKVTSTLTYEFPATEAVNSVRTLTMGHKMLDPDRPEYYPGIVGGKTGFTSRAGNTLVTCVERDGTRLIAVILKSSQTHYSDTKKLLDYGFSEKTSTDKVTGPTSSVTAGDGQTSQPYPGALQDTTAGWGEDETQSAGAVQNGTSGPGQDAQTGADEAQGQTAAIGRDAYPEAAGTWEQTGTDWKFKKEDGTYAANEYLKINGEVYGFGEDGIMLLEWHLVNGTWHNFRTGGNMAFSRWIQTNGFWYYVDENGSLFVNGTTPDGYRVDANGIWIQ